MNDCLCSRTPEVCPRAFLFDIFVKYDWMYVKDTEPNDITICVISLILVLLEMSFCLTQKQPYNVLTCNDVTIM